MAKDIKVRLYSNSKQFNSEMSSITRQMKVVKSEFEANKSSVNNWGNQLKQSEAKAKYLTQSIDLQKRRVKELQQAFNDSAKNKGRDAKETQNLAIRLNRATAELGKMQGKLKSTNAELMKFGKQQSSKKLEQDLKALSNESKRIDTQFKLAKTSAKNFGNEMKQTSLESERLKQKMTVQSNVIKRLEQEYKKVWSEKKKNTAEARNLASAIDQERIKLNNLQNGLTQTTAKMKWLHNEITKNVKSAKMFGDRMNRTGMEMRRMGMGVGIVSGVAFAGLTGAMKSAYEATANFEEGMSGVKALSGATANEMKALDKQARQLGSSTKFTATQASEGMQKLALAGWDAQQIMAGMPGMLDLAAAGSLDLATAADITSDTMQAFGLDAKKAGHAADVFAYAQANANTNVEQMGEYMQYTAPVANALGWSLEEAGAAAMTLANAGLKGGKAGQAFATSLSRLAKPTSAMKKEMKNLNMEFFDAEGNMKPLPGVMKEIEKGTKGMTREQKSSTLTTLFGAQAYKHWAILLEDGSKSLESNTKALEEADGAAKKMADTMIDNARGKITIFKSAVEGLQISLTRQLMPAFSDTIEGATDLVTWFTNLDEASQKTIAKTALLGAGILGVTTVVAGLTAAVGAFLTFAGPVGLAITGGIALLGGLGVALFAAKEHTKNLKKEQEKAQTEALRYGDNLSAGTKKGVKGYTDLYEGAKLKMLDLKRMSGEQAEKTSSEVVKAFSQMADKVITELETQKEKMANAINDVYAIAGDAGKGAAKKMTNEVLKKFDKDIGEYKQALDTVKEAHKKYNNDLSKMPAEFAAKYQEALKVMEGGSKEFAKNQEEIASIQKSISDRQGKIMYDDAQGYIQKTNKVYNESLQAANDWYSKKQKVFKQALDQGRITEEQYGTLMSGVQARTNEMLSLATQEYTKTTQELSKHLDDRGKLIDIKTGKEFERQKEYVSSMNGYLMEVEEDQNSYLERWKKHTAEVISTSSDFSKKSKDAYVKDLQAFLETTGMTKDAAAKSAKQTVDEVLKNLGKGNGKAKKAGKDKGTAHKDGLAGTKDGNKKAANDVEKATDGALKKGKPEANKHGKDKGTQHKQGLASTKDANKSAAANIEKSTDSALKQGKGDANRHGKDKGNQHKSGLMGTRQSNKDTALSVSSVVTNTLARTSDGGGGSKAGRNFKDGLYNWRSLVRSAGASVAGQGKSGLQSVDTSSAGSGFVSGFRNTISAGSGVWSAAWNLGKKALGALKSAIDSHSPSKLTEKEGINFNAGFANAIDKNKKKAIANAANMGRETVKALKGEVDKSNDGLALQIKAAANEIRSNKHIFTVVHKIDSSSLESQIEVRTTKMEEKLYEKFDMLINLMAQQLAATGQWEPSFNIDGRELARATRKPTTEFQAQDKAARKRGLNGRVKRS